MEIELSTSEITGYVLALVRAAAWVFVSPPFSGRTIPIQIKVGFAAALALALGPTVAEQGVALEAGPLLGAAVLQVAAGLALGFLGVLLFNAVSSAGSLIDLFAGFTIAQIYDPATSATTSIFGRFYQVLAITILFAIDGHLLLVRGFLTSFDAAPLTSFDLEALAPVLTAELGIFFVAAIEIAAPLLAALFLTEVALGLLSRAAPQMNVLMLGMPLKIFVALSLAGLALPLIPGALESLLRPIIRDGLGLLGG